ncbi:MAG: molybdenum cofactor guanylyltransferase [Deltaproteobacteria bacterium]|nr:molybdenum cofactor guanylyltransferase [Deltaproteobacteria bacterium]
MGADKALYLVDQAGRGLLSALGEELAGRFGEVVLVTDDRRKLASLAELQPFTLLDDQRPGAGPVGAILTALTYLPKRPVFVLACDMPVIDWEALERLKELMESAGAQAALPRRYGRLEPLHAFYGPGAAEVFAKGLAEGRFAVRRNLDRMTTVYLDCRAASPALAPFSNLNTLSEARRAGFGLLGLTSRDVGPGEPVEVLAETPFELVVDGRIIQTQAALPSNLDDLARGLMLARGLISGAEDLASLLVSADRRRVEAELKPASERRLRLQEGFHWPPGELAALFREFEGRPSPWRAGGAEDRASFAFPGQKEIGPIFEDLTPLAALDKALGRLLLSREKGCLILTSGRAGRETVERVLRAGARGLMTSLRPTAAAIDLARAAALFLAVPDSDRSGLVVYAD